MKDWLTIVIAIVAFVAILVLVSSCCWAIIYPESQLWIHLVWMPALALSTGLIVVGIIRSSWKDTDQEG